MQQLSVGQQTGVHWPAANAIICGVVSSETPRAHPLTISA
jgi:hypothetical protein